MFHFIVTFALFIILKSNKVITTYDLLKGNVLYFYVIVRLTVIDRFTVIMDAVVVCQPLTEAYSEQRWRDVNMLMYWDELMGM